MAEYNVVSVRRYWIYMSFDGTRYRGRERVELESSGDVTFDAVGVRGTSARAGGREVAFEQGPSSVTFRTGRMSGVLEVEFEGEAPDKLVGIYRAPYEGGYVISTQFESVHAREMFPCVDHPAYKARFKLLVEVPSDLHVISNMPIERVELVGGGRKVVEFYETPPMSTYLLYLGIGRWEEVQSPDGRYVVAAVGGRARYSSLALWAASRSVEFYERYFGIPYPLPKMHLIAVPEFAFGAMENWGAITFRESALLAPDNADLAQRRRVAEVVAHEIAHQWFGDLVTMRWWDDLWLNESFATFMSYKALSEFAPELRPWEVFLLSETAEAMERDSLSTTHPIRAEVRSPDEIEAIFDEISYGKGASVLRMVEYFLGESFRKGLSSYLEHFKYSNATAQDLWASIQPFTAQPVSEIMNDWVTKPGYPYVAVSVEGGEVRLEQHRFSLVRKLDDLTYLVPVTLEVNGRRVDVLMRGREERVPAGGPVRSLKANLDRAGFYRVLYGDLSLLGQLNELEAYGLLDDYYSFLMAGLVDRRTYESVVARHLGDFRYLVTYGLSGQLYELYLVNRSFADMAVSYHRRAYEALRGSQDEALREAAGVVARRLAVMDRPFAEELSKLAGRVEDPNLKLAAYTAYAVATSDLEGLRRMYESEQLDSEKVKVIQAAMMIPDRSVLERALEWVMGTKRSNYIYVFQAAYNPSGRDALWYWLKAGGLDRVAKAFEGTAIVWRHLSYAIPFMGVGREEEVRSFFESRPESREPGVRTGLELLEAYSRLSRL